MSDVKKLRWQRWDAYADHHILDNGGHFVAWLHPSGHEITAYAPARKVARGTLPGYVVEIYNDKSADRSNWDIAAEGIESLEDAKAVAIACWRMK